MRKIQVHLKNRSYVIHIEPGSLRRLGLLFKSISSAYNDIFIITDRNVASLYSPVVLKSLLASGFRVGIHAVAVGEKSKSIEIASRLYTKLIQFNLKRDGCIVALGGGVVGDLAGFVASTYLRGVFFVQIPTTLLSQVDSSVGGKVGINHPLGKNLIGSFYQPKLVLIDPKTLGTLDKREIWSGMAEVIKYGMIADKDLFDLISNNLISIVNLSDSALLMDVLTRCCQIKTCIIEKDEKESGIRRQLNFGHTFGHALETLGNFQYFKHGEAILYGMRWATWLSITKGYLPKKTGFRIQNLLKRFPVPKLDNRIFVDQILKKMKIDKKHTSEGLFLVLLNEIGKPRIERITIEPWMVRNWWTDVQS